MRCIEPNCEAKNEYSSTNLVKQLMSTCVVGKSREEIFIKVNLSRESTWYLPSNFFTSRSATTATPATARTSTIVNSWQRKRRQCIGYFFFFLVTVICLTMVSSSSTFIFFTSTMSGLEEGKLTRLEGGVSFTALLFSKVS